MTYDDGTGSYPPPLMFGEGEPTALLLDIILDRCAGDGILRRLYEPRDAPRTAPTGTPIGKRTDAPGRATSARNCPPRPNDQILFRARQAIAASPKSIAAPRPTAR